MIELEPYTRASIETKTPEEFTDEWNSFEPEFATVIRCPRCHNLVDNDEADCPRCGLEIKHRIIGLGEIVVLARDPKFIRPLERCELHNG